MRVNVRIKVSGRVQGVSFRAVLREKAVRNGVDGWVRNNIDGSVEAFLQGDEAAVRTVVEWSRVGPSRAKVRAVVEERLACHPREVGFRILE